MGFDYGAAAGGTVQGLGTIYAANLAADAADADRKQKKNIWNKDTKLKIAQFNMNQGRLQGLGSVLSGQRASGRTNLADPSTFENQDAYMAARRKQDNISKEVLNDSSDYARLNDTKYTV